MKKNAILCLIIFCLFASLTGQTLTSVILPQYIQGNTGTNSNRIPFVYRARLEGLAANATYRYYNQVVIATDAATTKGAGNCIFTSLTGSFFRTSDPGLITAGTYDSLTTDDAGIYEGWFITEPSGNARFLPGKYIFMRIMLNDGAGGMSVTKRLTTADSVRVVKLNSTVSDSTGTGLRCTSNGNAKDFVFLYDNSFDIGRPISGSFIESDGTVNTTTNNYTAFYANNVNGITGAFGVVLPNILPNGIKRIVQRSLLTNELIAAANDEDGVWPSGANTINPSGGTTAIVLTATDVQFETGVNSANVRQGQFVLYQNYPNPFNPMTSIEYRIANFGFVTLKIFDALGREVACLFEGFKYPGSYTVQFAINNSKFDISSGVYFYRLTINNYSEHRKMIVLR